MEQPIKIQLTPDEKVKKLLEICAVDYEPSPYKMTGSVLTILRDTKGAGKDVAVTLLAEYYRQYFTDYEDADPVKAIGDTFPVTTESGIYYDIMEYYEKPGTIMNMLMKKPFLVITGIYEIEGTPYGRSILDDIYKRRIEAKNRITIFVSSKKSIPNESLWELMKRGEVKKL